MSDIEPLLAPLNEATYGFMIASPVKTFTERQSAFNVNHPNAKEYVVLTEDGLTPAWRRAVKQLILDNTATYSVYAGINGHAPMLNGRLIDPADRTVQRFHDSFYATTRAHWIELGLMGDDNPVKHAVIKSSSGHPAIVAFDRSKLQTYDGKTSEALESNTSWSPIEGQTTETAVDALFHVVSLQFLLAQ